MSPHQDRPDVQGKSPTVEPPGALLQQGRSMAVGTTIWRRPKVDSPLHCSSASARRSKKNRARLGLATSRSSCREDGFAIRENATCGRHCTPGTNNVDPARREWAAGAEFRAATQLSLPARKSRSADGDFSADTIGETGITIATLTGNHRELAAIIRRPSRSLEDGLGGTATFGTPRRHLRQQDGQHQPASAMEGDEDRQNASSTSSLLQKSAGLRGSSASARDVCAPHLSPAIS